MSLLYPDRNTLKAQREALFVQPPPATAQSDVVPAGRSTQQTEYMRLRSPPNRGLTNIEPTKRGRHSGASPTLPPLPPTPQLGQATREDLVETQAQMISSLQTQLAAMTSLLQQGVRVPLNAAPPGCSSVHVRFDNRWQWMFDGEAKVQGHREVC